MKTLTTRKLHCSILILLLVYALGSCRKRQQILSEFEETEIEDVYIRQRIVNLGVIESNEVAVANFEIINMGDQTLNIKDVKPGCGCTTVALSNRVLLPGDTLLIPVKLDVSQTSGTTFRKGILVIFTGVREEKVKNLTLVLTGRVNRPSVILTVVPSILDYGDVKSGTVVRRTIYFRGNSNVLSFLPGSVEIHEPKNYTLPINHVEGSSDVQSNVQSKMVEFSMKFPKTFAAGHFRSSITIEIDGAVTERLIIPVKACVYSQISVKPGNIYLATSAENPPPHVDLTLNSLDEYPVVIGNIFCDLPLQWEILDSPIEYMLTVRVRLKEGITLVKPMYGQMVIDVNELGPQIVPVFLLPIDSPK